VVDTAVAIGAALLDTGCTGSGAAGCCAVVIVLDSIAMLLILVTTVGSKTAELAHDANVAKAPKKAEGTSPIKLTTDPVAVDTVYGNARPVASVTADPAVQSGATLSDIMVEIT
jgi:hypothetical protein